MLADASDIMSQKHEPAHVTGSALVIDATTGRFLLYRHKTLGRWLQVGGHCDPRRDRPDAGTSGLGRRAPRPPQVGDASIRGVVLTLR
jgi:hypothetical protein